MPHIFAAIVPTSDIGYSDAVEKMSCFWLCSCMKIRKNRIADILGVYIKMC